MELEDSNGTVTQPGSSADVAAVVRRLGNGIDHCILSDGDLFLQAAGSDPELTVQWGDGSNLYEASETLSEQTAIDLFSAFYECDPSWKTKVSFVPAEGGGSAPSGGRSLKDDVMSSVKGEIQYGISGLIRRAIRNILRSFR